MFITGQRLLRILRICAFAFLVSGFCFRVSAQNTTAVNPDCLVLFTITAQNGSGPAGGGFYDNRQIGCNSFQLSYGSAGFSAVSLLVQSSPDGGLSGLATLGTVLLGTNPLTSTVAASNLIQTYGTNFPPFVRVIATTATGTGTIRGVLLGWRAAGFAGTTAGGGTGTNGVVVGSGCALQAPITLSGSGNTRIINAGGTGTVRICEISFSTTAAEDIQITEGTGVNCGTGTANVTGLYKSVQSIVLDPQVTAPITAQVSGDDICLNQSMAQALGGLVIYAKF